MKFEMSRGEGFANPSRRTKRKIHRVAKASRFNGLFMLRIIGQHWFGKKQVMEYNNCAGKKIRKK